jgi:hypothetical protein
MGNYGSVTVKGHPVQMAVTPIDVYQLLEDGHAYAAAGYFSLSYDRFSAFVDSVGGYATENVNEQIPTPVAPLSVSATDKTKFVITDFALGYRLGQWSLPGRQRSLTLGVYAGARYTFFSNKLTATASVAGATPLNANVFQSFAWADPLIGVRWSIPVLDSVSLDFRGDIGGFGNSSNLTWGLVSAVRYWLPWAPMSLHPYLAAGYRVVGYDRSNREDNIQMQIRGPLAGAGFVF